MIEDTGDPPSTKASGEDLALAKNQSPADTEPPGASGDDLRSVNEALQIVNAELAAKVDALDRANSDLRNLFDSTQTATVFLDRAMVIRNYTAAASSVIDILPGDCGRPLCDLVGLEGLAGDVQRVLTHGVPVERSLTHDGADSHYLVRIAPHRDATMEIEGAEVTFIDVTSVTRSQADQQARLHEMQHRLKNVLATTGALAMRLLRDGPSLETFSTAFLGRLRAMAATHELLSRGNWNGARLRELLEMTLDSYAPAAEGSIAIAGPDLVLAPDPATTLGTVFYELATNAAKYGALSNGRGEIEMTWQVVDGDEGACAVLTWVEHGGPRVTAPIAEGFGTRFIRRCVEYELQGSATLNPLVSGVRWELVFPVKGNIKDS
jgi:two-component system, chemotaxis family, CheB/CheR fusion protein